MSPQNAVICFFVLFLTVYFLESIGGFYMTSAVVSIEKQFQIPSRMSGLMVSAGDFGYIPSVVFVSYLGGKGNRARWIGGGCLLIALANFLISMSNFLFPVDHVRLNRSTIELGIRSVRLHGPASIKSTTRKISSAFLELWPESSTASRINGSGNDLSKIRILANLPYAFCNNILNHLRVEAESIRCSGGPSNLGPFFLIFGGLLVLGIGRTMPFSLGLPLIDDNVKRKNLPVYFAGMFFIRILGPVLGFLIGSVTNNYYYSFNVPPGLTPRDPMWIGRWWAGFLCIGVIMFGPSLALYLFPMCLKKTSSAARKLSQRLEINHATKSDRTTDSKEMQLLTAPKTHKYHKKKRSLALIDRHAARDEQGNTVMPTTLNEKASDFFATVGTIIKKPVYIGALVGRILDVLAFKGFFVFLPKYLEIQFGLPQHKISLYLGIIGVSGFAVGVIIGSVTMRKLKLQGRKAAAYVAVCSTIAASLSFINATVGCKSALSLLGDQITHTHGKFNNTCNQHCSCDGMPLYPVCNRERQAFYSPCHAGCALDHSLAIFTDCICSDSPDRTVSRDFCDQSVCESKFKMYFIDMAISGIFGGMGVIPAVLIILRSVPPIDRSVSLGFQGFLVSLFATLPSPVIWGWIVDRSCVLWNAVCGNQTQGACALYDADKLRLNIHIIYGIMRLISLLSDIWVIYFAKNLILTDEEPNVLDNRIEIVQTVADDVIVDKDRKFSM